MNSPQCLFNSAVALRRVFINNAHSSQGLERLQRLFVPSLAFSCQPRRTISTTNSLLFTRPSTPAPKARINRLPRDKNIIHPWIHVRDEATGLLSEPQRTKDVLNNMDMKKYTLVMVAIPNTKENEDGGNGGLRFPICRMNDRKAESEMQAEKTKLARKKNVSTKEMELNWAIAPNDLNTKMRQLSTFLTKGYRVEISLMNKKRRNKRAAKKDEIKELLRAVREKIYEVEGTVEVKPMEGKLGETIKIIVQGPQNAPSTPSFSAE
ncbi:hypothetical protein B0H63DRAFT_479184 [Podospora didyma]|uniref:Translation initiation factor IF-3 n=1 Tax=Podospora didyma TaxID=330526 RepID=A0AAE0KL52_9PEZI|nr:hypothetical protein B0H63DRAFT_479184 [Podospora didyma]